MRTDTWDLLASTVTDWLETWQIKINGRDYAGARDLFDPEVLGYGTRTGIAHGLDELEQKQWRPTWSEIERFRFNLQELTLLPEGPNMVVACTTWTSLGIRADGSRFDRAGRMTLVLRRTDASEPWRALHTHFSVSPEPA
jgi:ketosteroid isomerase-like protein